MDNWTKIIFVIGIAILLGCYQAFLFASEAQQQKGQSAKNVLEFRGALVQYEVDHDAYPKTPAELKACIDERLPRGMLLQNPITLDRMYPSFGASCEQHAIGRGAIQYVPILKDDKVAGCMILIGDLRTGESTLAATLSK